MTRFVKRYIVQDLDSGEFLCPDIDGGIANTAFIKQAGKYDDLQDAIDAGVEEIGGQFALFEFYELEQQ